MQCSNTHIPMYIYYTRSPDNNMRDERKFKKGNKVCMYIFLPMDGLRTRLRDKWKEVEQ